MRILQILTLTLSLLSVTLLLTQSIQAGTNDRISFETIAQNDRGSGWQSREPGLLIVATPDELSQIHPLLHADDYKSLQTIDYDKYFVISVFLGKLDADSHQFFKIEMTKIVREGTILQVNADVSEVSHSSAIHQTSPYHIVQIEKEGVWGIDGHFTLSLNGESVVTQTHHIPDNYLPFKTVAQSDPATRENSAWRWDSEEVGIIVFSTLDDVEQPNITRYIGRENRPILKAIDYDQKFVIALFQHLQPSNGYRLEIERIHHRRGEVYIDAVTAAPSDGGQTENISFSPYHIVSLDKQPWWDRELDFIVSLDGRQVSNQAHHISNLGLAVESIHRSSLAENWQVWKTPKLILVNTIRDIPILESFIGRENVDLQAIDYSQYFVAALFQGGQGSTGYEISLERVRKKGNHLQLHGYARVPFVGETVGLGSTSPYHIVKIRREGNEWDQEMNVDILLNGTQVLTQTHYIPGPSKIENDERLRLSNWDSPDTRLEIVDTQQDLSMLEPVIPPEQLHTYRWKDYTEEYLAVLIQGQQPITTPNLSIQQVRREKNQVIIESITTELYQSETDSDQKHSPYWVVQMDRLYENDREIDFILTVDGQPVLTETHTITDPWHFTTLEKHDGPSGWVGSEPTFALIATPDEIAQLKNLVSTETLGTLQDVDYSQYYVVAAFLGQRPTPGYDIRVERISREVGGLTIHTAARRPAEPSAEEVKISPYHLVKVNREQGHAFGSGMRDPREEMTFAFAINGTKILTQTHFLPDLRPSSTLQGHFDPLVDDDGKPFPAYEISLENRGEGIAENILLSVSSEYGVDSIHFSECEGLFYNDCHQLIETLAPGQRVTRTFGLGDKSVVQAAQSCKVPRIYKEPVVTAAIDDRAMLYLTGPGEDIIAHISLGEGRCNELIADSVTGKIYPTDSDPSVNGPFIYTIELQSHDRHVPSGALYLNDSAYEIDEVHSDPGWTFDESDLILNETNRWRFNLDGRLNGTESLTISVAIKPIISNIEVSTEAEAYLELPPPHIVLDSSLFGINPIPLAKSDRTLTCRCFDVAIDSSISETYAVYMPMIVR